MPHAPTPRRPLRLSAVVAFFTAIMAGCGIESEYVGSCVEETQGDACTPARAGQCSASARFVEDESCEALGFTYACAGEAIGSERSATWVRSATTCVK